MRGRMSFTEAAFRLLASERRVMHYQDITDLALKRRMIQSCGLTPGQSLLGGMRSEMIRKPGKCRFEARGNGMYTLSRYGKRLAKKPRA